MSLMISLTKKMIMKEKENKKEVLVYEYDPKIYQRKLFVMKGCEIKDIKERLSTRDDEEIETEIEKGSEPALRVFPMVKIKDTGAYGELVVVFVEPEYVSCGMISHEAFHVAMDILSELGVMFHADNQEHIAYMVEWAAECIHDVITGEADKEDLYGTYLQIQGAYEKSREDQSWL